MKTAQQQRILTTLALACAFALAAATSASADTYTVDTGSDNGSLNACTGAAADCSLRGALGVVNSGSGGDIVRFNAGLTITIDSVLPTLTKSVTIESVGKDTVIRGSGTYASTCDPSEPALNAQFAGVVVKGIAMYDLCGRAMHGNMPGVGTTVGPRRADGSLPITGGAVSGTVEIFRADPPASGYEALSYLASVPSTGSAFSYVPPVEPSPGDRFTSNIYTANSSAGFGGIATTPSDITSPTLLSATAINNNSVRLDFSETLVSWSTPAPSAFSLTVAGLARGLVASSVSGNSLFLVSNFPWGTGETGSVSVAAPGAVMDVSRNELIGQPSAFVAAGPGELSAPVISRYKVSPRGLCIRYSAKCKRKEVAVSFTLNKAARVVFEVYRGKKFVVKFIRNASAGANKVRIFSMMNGRTLPITKSLVLRATPQDLARNPGAPVQAGFRGVTNRKDY